MSRSIIHRMYKAGCRTAAALTLAGLAGLGLTQPSAAAVDGNTYAVIAPTYIVPNGAQSYIRFFNAGSAPSTFTVSVVGSPSGVVYGTATYVVPSKAEIQKSFTGEILVDSAAGALRSGDTGYSIYMRNPDTTAGYQHVIFSPISKLFENVSNCKTTMNQALESTSTLAIVGIHTSQLTALGYPGVVQIHNKRPYYVTYRATVVDAATGTTICKPGTTTCSVGIGMEANETRALPFQSTFETPLSWAPTTAQSHAVLLLTEPGTSGAPGATLANVISNVGLGGPVDMTNICAVNTVAPVASPVSATAATIFDGTIAGSGGQAGSFSITIAATGSAASAPAASAIEVAAGGFEKPAATIERAQAVQNVTGTLQLALATSTIPLTGTYNSTTNVLFVAGGPFRLSGSVSGSTITGSYTATNTTGTFAAVPATVAAKANTYCGTYQGTEEAGRFNMVIGPTGVMTGAYNPTTFGDTGGTLQGQLTGSSLTGTSSGGGTLSGVVNAGAVSGRYSDIYDPLSVGTFQGNVCPAAR